MKLEKWGINLTIKAKGYGENHAGDKCTVVAAHETCQTIKEGGTADLKILKWVKTDSIPWGLSRLVHDDTRHEFLM